MPAYWLMYNQFALERNAWKYESRDKRTEKTQLLEPNYLAPDTINSIFESLELLEYLAGQQYCAQHHPGRTFTDEEVKVYGIKYLKHQISRPSLFIIEKHSFENSSRPVKLLKPADAYQTYHDYIAYYSIDQIINHLRNNNGIAKDDLLALLNTTIERQKFENVGGQMIPALDLKQLKEKIATYEVISWQQIHEFYALQGKAYAGHKLNHAIASLQELNKGKVFDKAFLIEILTWYLSFRDHLMTEIRQSRQKDYENPFRQMIYADMKEMEAVIGKLDKTPFIVEQQEKLKKDAVFVKNLISKFEL